MNATDDDVAHTPSSLAQALALAQARCQVAEHDREHSYHHYKYSSAESVIAAAKAALAETGLALLPVSDEIRAEEWVPGDGGLREVVLVRSWQLVHASGESQPIVSRMPLVFEKGRSDAVAVCIARTSLLAYVLRDLLLIPRGLPDDEPEQARSLEERGREARRDREAAEQARDGGRRVGPRERAARAQRARDEAPPPGVDPRTGEVLESGGEGGARAADELATRMGVQPGDGPLAPDKPLTQPTPGQAADVGRAATRIEPPPAGQIAPEEVDLAGCEVEHLQLRPALVEALGGDLEAVLQRPDALALARAAEASLRLPKARWTELWGAAGAVQGRGLRVGHALRFLARLADARKQAAAPAGAAS